MAGWLIFGCRTEFAAEVAEAIWRRGEQLVALVDNLPEPPEQPWAGTVPVLSPAELLPDHLTCSVAIPQTTPGHRHAVARDAMAVGLVQTRSLVDPTAAVARTAVVHRGAFVGAGAVVAALAEVGDFALVNRSASVGHHASVGAFASLGPGCVLGGEVTVGRGAFVGVGAVLAPGVTIGSNATVGAGAVVVRDVDEGDIVVGNPARVLRAATVGYQGVSVP